VARTLLYADLSFDFSGLITGVDRIPVLPQSILLLRKAALESSTLKKAVLVLGVIVLAPVLLVSLVALASGQWHPIGQTESGAQVSVSSVRSLRNNQRITLVRVHYKQPAQLPQGGPFVEMRARVRFDCSNGTAIPSSEWFYTRDRMGRYTVSKKANQDSQFGQAPEGGFAGMVSKSVCQPAN